MLKTKTFEEMKALSESEVIKYSCYLMDRKLELANLAITNEKNVTDESICEANKISEQLQLLAEARQRSKINS
ncbi:hypothetical protein [Enterococcus sp. DIV0187]|uniref:hypothetical protein n=1 Tax=Enterococcus sp. DIV0187 TaxID=2774644 RepID=UPI003F228D6E